VRREDAARAHEDAVALSSGRGAIPDFWSTPLAGGTHALALVAVGARALAALPALETRYPGGGWRLARETDLDAWLAELGLEIYIEVEDELEEL
jgi:hypothetical protein